MPTITEKINELMDLTFNGETVEARSAATAERLRIYESPQGMALKQAKLHLGDLQSELRKLNQTIDKHQKELDVLKAKIAAADHVVNVLGAVEAP